MEHLPSDFVSLPIIITDYDAIMEETKKSVLTPIEETKRSRTASHMTTGGAQKEPVEEQKQLDLGETAEEIWNRISDAMKNKVREACIEVLKRTECSKQEDSLEFEYDDDARFLD